MLSANLAKKSRPGVFSGGSSFAAHPNNKRPSGPFRSLSPSFSLALFHAENNEPRDSDESGVRAQKESASEAKDSPKYLSGSRPESLSRPQMTK
ncbi:hypothetical protein ALC57_18775 [Trachymyrmex cornetzi]|uniref:Uncharacterized protein n=1 Tax=Trachymyrmex cornetzi TaxID=471704 RepID=A0A151IR62_9HYME|nr:hypothetical protein ALC57_18775 [Trachymyrmex cornetzi]